MTGFSRGVWMAIGIGALAWAGAAGAQENLDRGKSGAQLYGSDCAICHKSPQKLDLVHTGGLFGLESFLREHYTASRESAAAITAYLKGLQQAAPAAPARSRVRKQTATGAEHGKPAASKQAEGRPPRPKADVGAKPGKSE